MSIEVVRAICFATIGGSLALTLFLLLEKAYDVRLGDYFYDRSKKAGIGRIVLFPIAIVATSSITFITLQLRRTGSVDWRSLLLLTLIPIVVLGLLTVSIVLPPRYSRR